MTLKGFEPFRIGPLEGFSPVFSHLVCMMSQARGATLASVKDLTVAELDYRLDDRANSIGALLAHIAATERWYQSYTFEKKPLEGRELLSLEAALDLGEKGRRQIRGNDLRHYLEDLRSVREKTIREFRTRDDAWLMEERPFTRDAHANNFYLWYHVFEDEINHRGQISLIRKRIRTVPMASGRPRED
jgi:uncharacterized damage-inducible protein DinB